MPSRAVILAGGKGRRLHPHTLTVPKPLLPLGDSTILDVLIRRLVEAGIERVTLAVGAYQRQFEEHLARNGGHGVLVDCVAEEQPLGTAGPLAQVPDLSGDFLVANGDLLTDVDFADLHTFHVASEAAVTIACQERDFHPGLGVVEVDPDGNLAGYAEKPVWSYLCSMGIYAISPEAVSRVPRDRAMDVPELVRKLRNDGERVCVYRFKGYWRDLGHAEEYRQGNEDFVRMRGAFLREGPA